MKLLHVVGARPNFAKVAPVHAACAARGMTQVLVHTGQHYDEKMSAVFLRDLGLPAPDVNLGVGSGSHAEQTARVMLGLEPIVQAQRPEWLLVYGDVNSTLAASLVAVKLGVRVAHVEAGLRSGDRTMPEEINRLVTDRVADLLLTPSADGDRNLLAEGVARERIRLVGNVMIDTLVRALPAARAASPIASGDFALVTLHRPSNVDDATQLRAILDALVSLSTRLPVVFPVHPRTRGRLGNFVAPVALRLIEPLGYIDFVRLQSEARVVVTDSGGVQEETTYLGVPCLTLRDTTERPVTVELGTNILLGGDPSRIAGAVDEVLAGRGKRGRIPTLWDGHAAERIAAILASA